MGLRSALGPLVKARESVKVFARHRPSIRGLLRSRAGEFRRAHPVLPSAAAAGEPVEVSVQLRDEYERLHPEVARSFTVDATDPEADLPEYIRFEAGHEGVTRADGLEFGTPGIQYLTLTHEPTGERFVSNPVRVTADAPDERVFWGDIHLHSILSDGTGSMAEGFRYGRDVTDLDVVAYTDHDTMGFFIPPSWQRRRMHGEYFDRMKETTEEFNDPGEFVTLFAYEWTKQPNVGGHINVYFDGVDGAPLFDSAAPDSDTYEALFDRLREYSDDGDGRALAVPHHPAEAMYPFDFDATDYDDEVAPLVEVYSQWGSSERPGREGNGYPLEMGQGEIDEPGHYVQDALRMGHRVGLIGGSDYHGPHPGYSLLHAKPHLPSRREWLTDGLGWSNIWRMWDENSYPGGLTAFRAPELTREAVFDALTARRVYATTQPDRILVDFAVEGVTPGDDAGAGGSTAVVDGADAPREVTVSVAGTAPLRTVRVVKNTEVWRTWEGTDDDEADLDAYTAEATWTDDDPVEGVAWDERRRSTADVYYVRVTQADDADGFPGMAWVGPVWVEAE